MIALIKARVDPLGVAGSLYLLAYLWEGQLSGLIFCVGILAALLAGYLLDGASLFVRTQRVREDLTSYIVGWLVLVFILIGVGEVSGVGALVDPKLIGWWAAAAPLFLVAMHGGMYLLIRQAIDSDDGARPTIIVGATQAGRALAAVMSRQTLLGLDFRGFFDDRPAFRTGAEASSVLGRLDDVTEYVAKHRVRSIYITLPMTSQPRILALLDALRDTTASIYFVPDMFVFDLIQARFDHVGGIPVMSVCDSPFEGVDGITKRFSDIVLSILILGLIWPVMVVIAIAVKLSSPGPAMFKQRRYGLDGKDIVVYKFRTMKVMEDGANVRQAVRNDERLTRIGGFLRRTSLDELPQFVNVLQGRMSIVGPRPHATAHNEQYRKLIKGYMVRHKVRPGITGWAQVSGFRGETDTLEKMERRIAYDLDYLRNWSLWLDLKIIVKTITTVIRDRHAY